MTVDIEKLKALTPRVEVCIQGVMARFPTDSKAYYVEVHQHLAPLARQLEHQNDALRVEVERLRAELATRCRAEGGDTSENTVALKRPENGSKIAETRIGSGFDGGAGFAAPAAGTVEKDATVPATAGSIRPAPGEQVPRERRRFPESGSD